MTDSRIRHSSRKTDVVKKSVKTVTKAIRKNVPKKAFNEVEKKLVNKVSTAKKVS